MNILLIGGGGREHALYWKLSQSPMLKNLYCAPGNGGTEHNIDLNIQQHQEVINWCQQHNIDMVVVGPEQPLVDGLADSLLAANIKVFGCNKAAAQLEGSKAFMKDLCTKANIPTAAYVRCNTIESAQQELKKFGIPVVIKADGLAAGKGVVVATSEAEAQQAIIDLIKYNGELVMEEFMQGPEVSFFALSDGKNVIPFTTAQDHKRAYDNDEGPNTGGMGAFSPARAQDMGQDFTKTVMETIIKPTLAHLGAPYVGVMYAGLMVVDGTPKLIEYNVRFGDPECQVMLPRLKNDLAEVLLSACEQRLDKVQLEWLDDTALTVVMAAKGYPGNYEKDSEIKNLAAVQHATVFHAGTKKEADKILANGGRVLNVTSIARSLKAAREKAYEAVSQIDWPEGFNRTDIGVKR